MHIFLKNEGFFQGFLKNLNTKFLRNKIAKEFQSELFRFETAYLIKGLILF